MQKNIINRTRKANANAFNNNKRQQDNKSSDDSFNRNYQNRNR